jgi:hypothetical protein
MNRYNLCIPKLPSGVSESEYRSKVIAPIQLRVVNVLKTWIEMSYFDMDVKLISRIEKFAEEQLIRDGYQSLAKQIANALQRQVSGMI